jgi:hypothetical protein
MIIRDIVYRGNEIITGYNEMNWGDDVYDTQTSTWWDSSTSIHQRAASFPVGEILVSLFNYDFTEFFKTTPDNLENIISKSPLVLLFKRNEDKKTKNYSRLLKDIKNIKDIYIKLIDDYLFNEDNEYLSFEEKIIKFNDSFEKESDENTFFKQRNIKSRHRVIKDTSQFDLNVRKVSNEFFEHDYRYLEIILSFENLGDFIYYEFFKVFELGYTIKRCKNCGKFFLNTTNYEVEYCDNVFEKKQARKKARTCREMGADKIHQEKIKNNPILLTYRRAYKAHYARVRKGKMTQSDFEEWGRWAMILRNQALNDEIDFSYYERELKK